jgi:hypothetical protein
LHGLHESGSCNQQQTPRTKEILVYADVNLLGDIVNTIKKNVEAVIDASKEDGLELKAGNTVYMLKSHH